MINENIQLLQLLNTTSKKLFETKKGTAIRIDNFENLNYLGYKYLYGAVINPLNESIELLNKEIFRLLNDIPIYRDYLKEFDAINIYDASNIIVEIEDIKRFKKFGHLLSYAGFSPKKNNGNKTLYQHLIRIAYKLSKNKPYDVYYEIHFNEYKDRYPEYNEERIRIMAYRKVIKHFLQRLYKIWRFEDGC